MMQRAPRGRCARHTLPGGWTLVMRSSELLLLPPASARASAQVGPAPLANGPHARQLFLPFPGNGAADGSSRRPAIDSDLSPFGLEERPTWTLPVPGLVSLPDGRRLVAELVDKEPGSGLSLDPCCVELDASGKVRRRVFADVAEIRAPLGANVELLLRDGSVKRGARVAPFLEGTYRILLPFADAATWRAAEIPLVKR